MDFLNHREGEYGFLSGFPPFSFTVYNNSTVETVRGCVSLKKLKSQGKAPEVTVISKEETLKIFVWISSKNFVSGFDTPSHLI